MEIHQVFSTTADIDDALLIDMDFTDQDENRIRSVYPYRASDTYSPLAPVIAQWLADHPDQEILPYIPPPEPTPEEIRALLPVKSMVQFRADLRKVQTPIFPDGIYADDINAMIDGIEDRDERESARDYFNFGQYAERTHPLVDAFGVKARFSPEQIDLLWIGV